MSLIPVTWTRALVAAAVLSLIVATTAAAGALLPEAVDLESEAAVVQLSDEPGNGDLADDQDPENGDEPGDGENGDEPGDGENGDEPGDGDECVPLLRLRIQDRDRIGESGEAPGAIRTRAERTVRVEKAPLRGVEDGEPPKAEGDPTRTQLSAQEQVQSGRGGESAGPPSEPSVTDTAAPVTDTAGGTSQ